MPPETAPERGIAERSIERLGLDLSRLVVLTEAASGAYLHTPLLAALAGAERVYALTRDSFYASRGEVGEATRAAASSWGVADRVEVGFDRDPAWLGAADIVTNSGFVRPIDAGLVSALKPTAVVPLMFESWELRPADLDLDACRTRGILVLGTDERGPLFDMRPYLGELGEKLLDELRVEANGSKVVVLGSDELIAASVAERLRAGGAAVARFGSGGGASPYAELAGHLRTRDGLDALIVAEHRDATLLIGPGGAMDPAEIAELTPGIGIGVIAGNVDAGAVRAAGLRLVPEEVAPFGHMSYQPSELGPAPVLELYATGLKVGEAMARARLGGAEPADAARLAIASSPAQDLPGGLAWLPRAR